MDETLDELLNMLPQQETYLEGLQRFSAEHRRLEWLSVRVLLFTLLGEEKEIAYYPSGKPYLADKSASISISHTRGYVSVIIGEAGKEVGIDIEQYGDGCIRWRISICVLMNLYLYIRGRIPGRCCSIGRPKKWCSSV